MVRKRKHLGLLYLPESFKKRFLIFQKERLINCFVILNSVTIRRGR